MHKRLGRLHIPDDRDGAFLMKSLIPKKTSDRKFKYWYPHLWWGDQGNTPKCVAYSWCHWLAEGPVTQKNSRAYHLRTFGEGRPFNPHNLYKWAQQVDAWPGEAYDGTSVRAGAKILKKYNFISSYYWSWDIDEIVDVLLNVSPIVVGTIWTKDMFYPDEEGMITPTGRGAGGHAYLLDGVNVKRGVIRIKNSWGRKWGNKGFAYMAVEDFDKLLRQNGEACVAKEINKI